MQFIVFWVVRVPDFLPSEDYRKRPPGWYLTIILFGKKLNHLIYRQFYSSTLEFSQNEVPVSQSFMNIFCSDGFSNCCSYLALWLADTFSASIWLAERAIYLVSIWKSHLCRISTKYAAGRLNSEVWSDIQTRSLLSF